ncbi:MAG: hypothetical protein A2182_03155 [Candidatus Pacebacteria bacterium RIFOXYA1_FULL_38_18]|nr:MAG: hypothetical protein A2182_03155 [Candidatus Pacebacteria bacterium RIFOXYA1_FULL_38_18]OGJ39470.1 MAG: hypothetical protein A2411_01795 [Candidatus Pacebacteria bacterium RIFOXYC1_FULL_39_21]
MMKPIIEVSHLSKKYKYGESQPYYTLRDALVNFIKTPASLLSKKQSSLKKNEFWALKDVSFKLNQGDVLGILGPNGSGKSTLLKILSRITFPTEGSAMLRGTVGSLLEVGTGFQQELTGRDNIYLNGAILGMKKSDITKKFDEIVNFSGVEKFIDTPVKHYSSGMYMRLAFSVAAHLDSRILIVDEVLAVGDAEFQKKCLGKMESVSKNEGRTVLFVSHNMMAVKRLCQKGILLKNGKMEAEGSIESVISKYAEVADVSKKFIPIKIPRIGVTINKISINKKEKGKVYPGKPLKISIELSAQKKVENIGLQIMISSDATEGRIFSTNTKTMKNIDVVLKKGKNHFTCDIHQFNLCSGKYKLGIAMDKPFVELYYNEADLFYFDVLETILEPALLPTLPAYGRVYMDHEWTIE